VGVTFITLNTSNYYYFLALPFDEELFDSIPLTAHFVAIPFE